MDNEIYRCMETCTFAFPQIKFSLIYCPSFIMTTLIFSRLIFSISFLSLMSTVKVSAQTTNFFPLFKNQFWQKSVAFYRADLFWGSVLLHNIKDSPFIFWWRRDNFYSIELPLPLREEKHISFPSHSNFITETFYHRSMDRQLNHSKPHFCQKNSWHLLSQWFLFYSIFWKLRARSRALSFIL